MCPRSRGSASLIPSRAWGMAWKDHLGQAEGCWRLDIGAGHCSIPYITYSPLSGLPRQAHGRKREAGFELQRGLDSLAHFSSAFHKSCLGRLQARL